MKIVKIHEVKTQPSVLLAEVEETGRKILIKRSRIKPHAVMSNVSINDDPAKPLAEDEWPQRGVNLEETL
jgi:hypothetical protein